MANSTYHLVGWSAGPEMISGVRASSMRIESTSSTIAKWCPRWTSSLGLPRHVVAQVVEPELVVRAVGDVLGVLRAALLGRHRGEDAAGLEAEGAVDAAHQLGLVLGEVVVDRDDVHALAGERVEVGRQRRDEGLALTGLHLGDVAQVQRRAAHDLHVEVPLAEGALARLADRGERLGQQVVEGLAVGEALAEDGGLLAQLLVGELLEVVLEGVDLRGDACKALQDPALTGAQQLLDAQDHGASHSRLNVMPPAAGRARSPVWSRDLPRLVAGRPSGPTDRSLE